MSTLLFGSLLIAFLILIYPLLDIKYTKSLKEKKDSESRLRYYKFAIVSEWLVVFVIMVFVLISPNINFKSIGLTSSDNFESFLGMIFGFLIGVAIFVFILMKIPVIKKRQELSLGSIDFLLPVTKLERTWSIFVAITAGVCEEIIYRGFVMHYLSSLPIELEQIAVIIISAVIFGVAHAYQGWKGIILTGLMGFVFANIYVKTGSLLFPILFHIIIDMRSFLFVKPLSKET
ncbi:MULTISPECIES: CPBP family intramembrane glutamic endopeptidase [Bacillaceae]|uniref:CPBP family intramembrane metalloprotease n=1 Tax=Neobacillus thermocopriae TaxID=1215031 RepID=A0A6B3TS80_9BACI|nr:MULTISPECIES: CPBP family intramembrane glutamic endopeptidase [Bacillaceae]MED3622949.1 CPBP family intramembrane metalloprotease [Neobacillus thermocopriae]MED3713223.1 CPBP family intramembrane metalloprotease [Neobacillus thermocopriae]NEX79246.1 CPBP family intramembrane metalloprotease [Neobacillus thermocopriae]